MAVRMVDVWFQKIKECIHNAISGDPNSLDGGLKKSLNTIYLTLNTQKAQRTYRHVLEGADVGVLWSYVVEEPGENH